MTNLRSLGLVVTYLIISLPWLAHGAPRPQAPSAAASSAASSSYWLAQIPRQGTVAFGSDSSYKVFRNVKDYGAVGDGNTDDTAAINKAISDQNRCGQGCDSSTTLPAIIYFPPGQYAISAPIVQYYYTQFIGDAVTLPTIVALPSFQGLAMLDSDPYIPNGGGANWYTNQNNFFRQIRNFKIDMTRLPESDTSAGIHWQVAQATSLQNIEITMLPKSPTNKQQGIFMDNGSGGFLADLTFNGGNYGAFFGNQQFTTRNLKFNGCNTAIFMNWNWLWTFKSVTIDNCGIGIDMSNLANGVNQTVGSVILLDSTIKNSQIGIKTAYNSSSLPPTGGTFTMQNVDFTGTNSAVVGADGSTVILPGGSKVNLFAQGDAYVPVNQPARIKREPQAAAPSSPADHCAEMPSVSVETVSPLPASGTSASPLAASGSPVNAILASGTSASALAASGTPVNAIPASGTSVSPLAASGTPVSALPASETTVSPAAIGSNSTATSYGLASASPAAASTCASSAIAVQSTRVQQTLSSPTMPASLMNNGVVFERSKPQYESVPLSAFVSVKSAGAKGDGVTDDSDAIQKIFNTATADQIVYFDHGAYVVTKTINVPKNIRITGEIWPLIMATGTFFSDASNPKPVFDVGNAGDTGSVEISDIIFETMGPAPGAIIVRWNVQQASQGSCGMWDVHFRIGGSAGTKLQQDMCQANVTNSQTFKPECAGSFLNMQITQQATAYLENCWFWTADHELDLPMHNQTNIYNGRGLLVESQGPVWLWGTSAEHSQLYNYQIANAKDIFMGAIQTETAYMQSAPNALAGGFTPNPAFSDPDFADCTTDSCKKTWGLRVVDSSNVLVYGAGLYSFFDNYLQTCLDTESCQENMVDIQCSSNVVLYGLTTKASTNMVTVDGQVRSFQKDHTNGFGSTLALFHQA